MEPANLSVVSLNSLNSLHGGVALDPLSLRSGGDGAECDLSRNIFLKLAKHCKY